MGIERRQIRRKQVSVETILDEGKAYHFTVSGNLSEAGVFLHTKIPFPLGANIRMLLVKPPHLRKISVGGIVKWSKGNEGLGIEFKDVSPRTWQSLSTFLTA
jgi:hypothetical protein